MLTEKRRKEEGLKAVTKKFKYWRTHRQRRGPIPPDLLAEARSLSKIHPLGILARALRINYNTLKKSKWDDQPAGESRESARGTKEEPASFVEISMAPPVLKSGGWGDRMGAIEFESPQGYKARFYTSQDPTNRIEELLTALFRPRR